MSDLPRRLAQLVERQNDIDKNLAELVERFDAEREQTIAALVEVWETLADVCSIFQAQACFNNAVAEAVEVPFVGSMPNVAALLADVDWPDEWMRPIDGEPGWRLAPDGSKRYSSRWL